MMQRWPYAILWPAPKLKEISGGFLPLRGSCTCTPDAPLRPALRRNGPKTNLWSLVGFVPTYYSTPSPSPMSHPYPLSSPIVIFSLSFPIQYPYYTIDLRTSLRPP